MDIRTLAQHREALARTDPLGAAGGDKHGRDRDWHPEAFFHHGEEEVAATLHKLERLGIAVHRGRALDVGCGVGRLTQALARRFARVDGVDLSPTMVELARHYNRFGDRCQFHLSEAPDLALFERDSFDFIVARLVLEHLRPASSRAYVAEFVRLLHRDGVAAFQVPSKRLAPSPAEIAAQIRRDPMPDEAFRAEIVPDRTAMVAHAALPLNVRVTVRNASSRPWPDGRRLLRLGGRWLTQDGAAFSEEGGRAPLPVALGPGDETQVAVRVRAPDVPGAYLLELDLVQEFVSWFARKGSSPARIPVRVEAPAGGTPEAPPVLQPQMERHAVPRATVEALVQSVGGRVLLVRDDTAGDPEWERLQYYVGKQI